ncbi:helix-turn-helix domain-containing protein [Streptomyces sp. Da 82-17]|uniref:helix-turn-helix domain-containing protein n=1 Tax=Streptomyces sp. Da 82-17 TaxID=3377116 RepID=UPI0038D4F7DE
MNDKTSRYADLETLRQQAIELRRAGLSLREIRNELKVYNNDLLNHLVNGEPSPARRHRAKDDLRARARELRLQGWTYNRIQEELGCSKSSISLWVRDLPRPEGARSLEEASALSKRAWEEKLQIRDEERSRIKREAAAQIGEMTDRELFMTGVALYWAEGSKDKSHQRRESLQFINSDPDVITLYLAWLDLLDVPRERVRFRVSIHESADVERAEQFWADLAGIDVGELQRTTLKKHNPKTNRKNTGDGYHGCLVIYVLQSADLYRRMEGAWCGIVGAVSATRTRKRT